MLSGEIFCLFHLFPSPPTPNRGLTMPGQSTPHGEEPELRESHVNGLQSQS